MSNTYSEIIESYGKQRKRYVYNPKDRSKPTCLVHVPGHSSEECKVLGDFGSNYAKGGPTKYRGQDTANKNKFNSQQENNFIVNSAIDEILLHGNKK